MVTHESDSRIGAALGRRRLSRIIVALAAACGFLLATDIAFATGNWAVGVADNSSGEAQSGTVQNLTIAASASPSPTNLLYPGSSGDVVVEITNPNNYPVTITNLTPPATSSYATGYTSTSFIVTNLSLSCTALTSDVYWTYGGTNRALASYLVVGASGTSTDPLYVTLTGWADMSSSAPAACEGIYFSMPSLTTITAYAGGTPGGTNTVTDS